MKDRAPFDFAELIPMRRLLFVLIIAIAGSLVLVSLGNWQMRRLDWKEGVLNEITQRIADDPVALPDAPDVTKDRYLAVAVQGEMLPGEVHVLVSVKRVGPGYRIIAPYLTDDGRRILVDRGFTRTENKANGRILGPMKVSGNLHWPDEIDGYTPDPDIDENIWFARDVSMLADALGTQPILLIARSETDPGIMPLPVDTAGIPNDHLQYAVTWYGLALVWIVMSIYFLWRSRAAHKGEEP